MEVVLDTNVLFKDPYFKNTEMQQLISLTKKGIINLNIPDIVLNEFKTQRLDEYKKAYHEYESKLNMIKSKSISKKEIQSVEKGLQCFIESRDYLLKGLDYRINDFLKDTKAKVLSNTPDDLSKMLSMYFNGEVPFKNIKSKEDIPDCLIYLQIMKLENAYVICEDNSLRKAIETKHNVFDSIKAFLLTSKELLEKEGFRIAKELSDKYIQSLKSNIYIIKDKILRSLENELTDYQIRDNAIRDDNNEGLIEGTPSIDDIEIEVESIQDENNGFYSFDFNCEFETMIEYFFFKSDYYCLDPEETKNISISDWNEHYFEAEEEMNLICIGKLSIEIGTEEIDFDHFEEIINDSRISFQEIKLSVKQSY